MIGLPKAAIPRRSKNRVPFGMMGIGILLMVPPRPRTIVIGSALKCSVSCITPSPASSPAMEDRRQGEVEAKRGAG